MTSDRPENPCVDGSIPPLSTSKITKLSEHAERVKLSLVILRIPPLYGGIRIEKT